MFLIPLSKTALATFQCMSMHIDASSASTTRAGPVVPVLSAMTVHVSLSLVHPPNVALCYLLTRCYTEKEALPVEPAEASHRHERHSGTRKITIDIKPTMLLPCSLRTTHRVLFTLICYTCTPVI